MAMKKAKLGTKLFDGFSVVLILAVVVAYVGYKGLTGVSNMVEKVGVMSTAWLKGLLDARQLEKDYVLTGNNA